VIAAIPTLPVGKTLRSQIREIVELVLKNIGKIKESKLEDEKEKYAHSPELAEVFDLLIYKYTSTIKTKEEMVKYVLRKAFKAMKYNYKKQLKMDNKTACSTLAKKYFGTTKEEFIQ